MQLRALFFLSIKLYSLLEMKVQIDPIKTSEIPELVRIAVQTFDETFGATHSDEDMQNYNERCFTPEVFSKEFKEKQSWFYFARLEDKIAGYLKINTGSAQTELREEDGIELERIYVLKEFLGRGVGDALMRYAIQRGKEEGKSYLWLGVYEENYRALSFYKKYGMEEFGDHVFMMGKLPERDILMRINLI